MTTARASKKTSRERDRSGILYVDVGADSLGELDAWIERINEKSRGPRCSRAIVVKTLLADALERLGADGIAPWEAKVSP